MIDRETVTEWVCEHGVDNTMPLAECITAAHYVAQKAAEAERAAIQALIEESSHGISSLDATEFYSDLLRAIRARSTGGAG